MAQKQTSTNGTGKKMIKINKNSCNLYLLLIQPEFLVVQISEKEIKVTNLIRQSVMRMPLLKRQA